MDRLKGKVVLVTGAARGLGEAIARGAVGEGAKVVLVDILDEPLKAVAGDLGRDAAYRHLDVRSEVDWESSVAFAQSHFGHLDVLVNNAAILRRGYISDWSIEDIHAVIAVNQYGPFLGMKAAVPAMRARGRGSIINIGSNDALQGIAGVIGYAGSKWALRGMTKVAAQELGRFNIRANSVHPGGMLTPMSAGPATPGRTLLPEEAKLRWALQRFPDLPEVASAVLFLASEHSSYTTGADITCDGGATLGPLYVNA